MKCTSCGGRLEGAMNFCSFCGVRQDIDLRQINFRDLGTDPSMPCPHCENVALGVVEFDFEPKMTIERCQSCYGLFFNPGELECLLESSVNPLIRLDIEGLNQITADYAHERELVYRKCPKCAERMSHVNFGGRSGVILDQCGTHGVWMDGGALRHLSEWWRAGGKMLYQQNEQERATKLYGRPISHKPRPGSVESEPPEPGNWPLPPDSGGGGWALLSAIGWLLAALLD